MKYISFRIKIILTAYLVIMGILNLVGLFVSTPLSVVINGIRLGILLLFVLLGLRFIYKPFRELKRAYKSFAEGYMIEDLFNQRYRLSTEHQEMLSKMKRMLDQRQTMDSYRQQAQYLALQNQINPHFLYNTLEGIRSEALRGELPDVAEMAEMLARFFRYTISNLEKKVTIEDELNNVRYYFNIQKFRFEDKIHLELIFESDEELVRSCRMPKLILQPIVENAICHGIEPLVGQGIITIRFTVHSERLLITVSDNGVGLSAEQVDSLNEKVRTIYQVNFAASEKEGTLGYHAEETDSEGGIAVVNINNRIKLIYGQDYGLHFYSKVGMGTDVEISLPLETREELR